MKGVHVPIDQHPLKAERHWQVWTEIVFISICHQTNWDRLHSRIIEISSTDLPELFPSSLCNMDSRRFNKLFLPGLDVERTRGAERLKILRELGKHACDWPKEYKTSWTSSAEVRLSGQGGVYAWLDHLPVFAEDPIKKKARVLVHQLLRYGLISVADPEHIAPAVDYHIMRLYARTARVRPRDDESGEILQVNGKSLPKRVTDLRRAVEEAMYYTAMGAEIRIDELNHIEWQIARSFCIRIGPRCNGEPLSEKPIDTTVSRLSCQLGGKCPLVLNCQGIRDPKLREIVDPRSIKSYY